ncbi:MAG: helix-turn-helix domain-containing protein [Acidimicrobiales bacterium]
MRIRTARDLGALIRDRRTMIGWSQQDLADHTGASKRWVVAIEAGKAGAEIGLVLRALSALDLELSAAPVRDHGAAALDALLDDLDSGGR